MSHWNYRILAKEYARGEIELIIHHVYYDDNGEPISYGDTPAPVIGESPKDMEWVLEKMKEAIKKPIIWGGERFPEEFKFLI